MRVAVVYDDTLRPETTGTYCRRALIDLVRDRKIQHAEHLLPNQALDTQPNDFDCFIYVDDGLAAEIPEDGRASAWWAIDTHLDLERCERVGRAATLVFAAQRDGAEQLSQLRGEQAEWLPLACDPLLHQRHAIEKSFDICFVGSPIPGLRTDRLKLLQEKFPNTYVGRCYFEEMARIYSASRIVFNQSIRNDINMRVFEALASGSMLLTNDLESNGMNELVRIGQDLVVFSSTEELIEKSKWYLGHNEEREAIASSGRRAALERHTYRHRMESILSRVTSWKESRRVQSPGSGSYYGHERRDVLEMVPLDVSRVLDIGCGAGRLGRLIQQRQGAQVDGVEINPAAAVIARTHLNQVFCCDIETTPLAIPTGAYDCIILADVLEHLREPRKMLERVHRWLSSNGVLVASLPNVGNISILQSLLAGNFTYEPAGLLDHTHLRFFTRREAEKTIYRAGFDLEERRTVFSPEPERWNNGEAPQLGGQTLSSGSYDPEGLCAYQYLFRARRGISSRMGRFPRTSIVIVTHNQWGYTKECLDSILLRTDEPIEIILVDNGSTDGTPEHISSYPSIRLIRNATNRGFPAAANQGIAVSTGDYVLLLNNDTVVTTGWLREMIEVMESQPEIALVGPMSNRVSGPQQIAVDYERLEDLDGFAWARRFQVEHQVQFTDRLVGFCLLVKSSLLQEIGELDEQFGVGNFEDDDLCRRAIQSGAKCAIATRSFVHHFGGATFGIIGQDYGEILRENQAKYDAKWAPSRQSVESTSTDLVTRVLELPIGCVLAVRNRSVEALERTLLSYANQSVRPIDQVLIDYGSDPEHRSKYEELARKHGWRLFFVDSSDKPWSSSTAYNLGASLLSLDAKVVFKNDADVILSSNVLQLAFDHGRARLCLFDCIAASQDCEYRRGITDRVLTDMAARQGSPMEGDGLHSFPRAWFDSIGGYDRRFQGWGFEDSDLRHRAERSIGIYRCKEPLLWHQWHPVNRNSELTDQNGALYESSKANFSLVRNGGELTSPGILATPVVNGIARVADSEIPPDQLAEALPRPRPEFIRDPHVSELRRNSMKLSAALIVRNNSNTIRPCLQSLIPWVDEVIVVDTGSSDGTPQICRELGTRVFEWPWKDDFSMARNVSVNQALGEWIFWMDSDDTLPEECGRKLRSLVDGPHGDHVFGYVMQVHCPGEASHETVAVDHVKLFRNRPDLRFEFRIHEQIIPSIRRAGGEVEWTDIYVVHSGSDKTSDGRKRKLERDFRILSQDLAERPDHPFVLFNIGMTYADDRQYGLAIRFLQRCIEVSTNRESHLKKAYSLLASSLHAIGDHEGSLACSENGLLSSPDDAELRFRKAMALHDLGRLSEARDAYLHLIDYQGPREFSSSDVELCAIKARHNLGIVLLEMGDSAAAEKVFSAILEACPDYRPAWRILGDEMVQSLRYDEAGQLAKKMQSLGDTTLVADGLLLDANLALAAGERDKCLKYSQLAVTTAPTDDQVLENVCRLLMENGFLQEAAEYQRILVGITPESAAAWHNLAAILLQLEHWDDAELAIEQSLRIRPESGASQQLRSVIRSHTMS